MAKLLEAFRRRRRERQASAEQSQSPDEVDISAPADPQAQTSSSAPPIETVASQTVINPPSLPLPQKVEAGNPPTVPLTPEAGNSLAPQAEIVNLPAEPMVSPSVENVNPTVTQTSQQVVKSPVVSAGSQAVDNANAPSLSIASQIAEVSPVKLNPSENAPPILNTSSPASVEPAINQGTAAQNATNPAGLILGITIPLLFILALAVFGLYTYFKRRKRRFDLDRLIDSYDSDLIVKAFKEPSKPSDHKILLSKPLAVPTVEYGTDGVTIVDNKPSAVVHATSNTERVKLVPLPTIMES